MWKLEKFRVKKRIIFGSRGLDRDRDWLQDLANQNWEKPDENSKKKFIKMNYGEDELGSFGDENEIKVSPRVFFIWLGVFTSTRFDPN